MGTKIEIICFTDLEGSTALTQERGHADYLPEVQDHLRVGIALAERNGGIHVKTIGDAHMVRFEELESALSFAAQLQWYYADAPCRRTLTHRVRIGLFQGAVQPEGNDVFGSGVNQAARVQGKAEPGCVLVNAGIVNTANSAFGPSDGAELFRSIGPQELKGIKEPATQELFLFDWQLYSRKRPSTQLANLVFQHLQRAGVELSNVNVTELATPKTVIWPVVPRDLPTAIHRAQVEVLRLLAGLGWRLSFLVADCGDERTYDRRSVQRFANQIEEYLAKRGLCEVQTILLSDLFAPQYPHYEALQLLFRNVTSMMSVRDLPAINNKEYAEEVKLEIQSRPTLTYLRVPLTIAAVLFLASRESGKAVVVSGRDERLQWTHAYTIPGASDNIGALMIPIVQMDPKHQLQQKERWPIWDSEAALSRNCRGGRKQRGLVEFSHACVSPGVSRPAGPDWERMGDARRLGEPIRFAGARRCQSIGAAAVATTRSHRVTSDDAN